MVVRRDEGVTHVSLYSLETRFDSALAEIFVMQIVVDELGEIVGVLPDRMGDRWRWMERRWRQFCIGCGRLPIQTHKLVFFNTCSPRAIVYAL
jgi:hypothetical protein